MTQEQLLQLVLENSDLMTILTIIRSLSLPDSWLCAGTIRNFIWNYLSNKPLFDTTTDVDVVFFDPTISYQQTLIAEQKLKNKYPQYRWELKNQVDMHSHTPNSLPYTSTRDAISKFPETATAIGLRLTKQDTLELFTPFGLDDLCNFSMVPTPYFSENKERLTIFNKRKKEKNWKEKWPQLQYPSR